MANDKGLFDIFKPLCDKVDLLNKHIELLKCIKCNKPESLKILTEIDAKRRDLVESVEQLNWLLKEQKGLNIKMQVLQAELSHSISKVDRLEELITMKQVPENNNCGSTNESTQQNESASYMAKNLQASFSYGELSPVEVNTDYPSSSKSSYSTKKCSLVFDIDYLSMEDFKTIPRYMLGSLSLDEINKFVDVVNSAHSKKYQILSKSRSSLKTQEMALYRSFKKQSSELRDTDFITEEDIAREFGLQVLGKKAVNFLAILRHVKKLSRKSFAGGVAYIVSNF